MKKFNQIKYPVKNHQILAGSFILVVLALGGCATLPDPVLVDDSIDSPGSLLSVDELIEEGDTSFQGGDIDSAQVSYALAVERAPENVEALFKLGFVHSEKSSLRVAESVLRHALRQDPKHLASKQTLAMILMRLERLDEADVMFSELIEENPSGWEAFNGLGVVRDMQGRHPEAQEYFLNALALRPRTASISNNLGYSFYMAGDYGNAELHLRKAIQFDTAYERAWSNLALVFSREGRYKDASAAFQKIVRQHQAANNLGYLGLLQGDKSLAREQLNQAIILSPTYYDVATRNLENIDGRAVGSALDVLPNTIESSANKQSGASVSTGVGVVANSNKEVEASNAIKVKKQKSLDIALMQRYLNYIGFDVGNPDGLLGENTISAVKDFQRVAELEVDGKIGPATKRTLLNSVTLRTQKELKAVGYQIKASDGVLNESTKQAIRKFQTDQQIPVSGIVDGQLIDELVRQRERVREDFNSIETPDLTARG